MGVANGALVGGRERGGGLSLHFPSTLHASGDGGTGLERPGGCFRPSVWRLAFLDFSRN